MITFCLLCLLACGEKTIAMDTSHTEDVDNGVEARLLLTSLNDRPQIEISVRSDFDNQTTYTEEDGVAALRTEPNAQFVFTAIENDGLQHRYLGHAPADDFAMTGLFLDRGSWLSLLGAVGLTEETGRGHLWVSIADPEGNAIGGASASLNATSDSPFVLLESNLPWAQDSLDENGHSILFFPNIDPQAVEVTVDTPNDLTCNLFVNHPTEDTASTTIYASTASILSFVCSE